MDRIKFDLKTLQTMALFESITKAQLKDCIINENSITFIVGQKEIAKAIGSRGANARALENALKRKIRIVEFSPDPIIFIRNLTFPAEIAEAEQEGKVVKLRAADTRSRGLLIGREANILRAYESVVRRHFDIEEIKVV